MEPLNKSSSAVSGSFPPTLRYRKREIHKVFPRFRYLDWSKNLSLTALADLIRASISRPLCPGYWAGRSVCGAEKRLRRFIVLNCRSFSYLYCRSAEKFAITGSRVTPLREPVISESCFDCPRNSFSSLDAAAGAEAAALPGKSGSLRRSPAVSIHGPARNGVPAKMREVSRNQLRFTPAGVAIFTFKEVYL